MPNDIIRTIKLKSGRQMAPVRMMISHGRIFFSFKYNKRLKDDIKSMAGWQWHGHADGTHQELLFSVFGTNKIWSIREDVRNAFQLTRMVAIENPYERWDAPPLQGLEFRTRTHKYYGQVPVYDHQRLLVATTLARNYVVWAAEMRSGKTLAAIEVMERRPGKWWFVAPKSALSSVRLELNNWDTHVTPRLLTYDELKKVMANWIPGALAPDGVFFDESHCLKNPSSQRSLAARALADGIRADHGQFQYWKPAPGDPHIICMTGSPAPRGPDDFWNQCEIVAPGFLKEGSINAFRNVLGLFEDQESAAGWAYKRRITWLNNSELCGVCGRLSSDHYDSDHPWTESVNEVDRLYRRMNGLTTVLFTRDCIDIAPRLYRTIELSPLPSTLRAARLITGSAARSAEAQILLRELSDGFQYRKEDDGTRTVLEAHSPKEEALQDILEEHSEDARLVVYAGFQGSIDKVVKVATTRGWYVISWDGRGVKLLAPDGSTIGSGPDYVIEQFNTREDKIVFVGQADSAGTGLNLSKADEIVYYSNSFKADSRIQSEARCDAPGKRGVMITDFNHLPTDALVLRNLREKKDTQSIALGDLERVLREREENEQVY